MCGFRVRVSHLDLLFVALISDLMGVQCLALLEELLQILFNVCRTSLVRSLHDPMFQKVGVYLRYNIVAFTFHMFQHINHRLW